MHQDSYAGTTSQNEVMFHETHRLRTYLKFPLFSPVDPIRLAHSGFFFTRFKDRVKCFSCGCAVENWVHGDDVSSSGWHFANCAFMFGENSGNIPVGFHQDALVHPRSLNHHLSERAVNPVHGFLLVWLDLCKESARRTTFDLWPAGQGTVTASVLARSGFYYLGYLRVVQCFSCRGILLHWRHDVGVHEQHRRSFPACRMVQNVEPRNIPVADEPGMADEQRQLPPHAPTPRQANLSPDHPLPPLPVSPSKMKKQPTEKTSRPHLKLTSGDVKNRKVAEETLPSVADLSQDTTTYGQPEILDPGCPAPSGMVCLRRSSSSCSAPADESPLLMQEQIEKLEKTHVCKVCSTAKADIVFLPCGHRYHCRKCQLSAKECPLCHKVVEHVVRTFNDAF